MGAVPVSQPRVFECKADPSEIAHLFRQVREDDGLTQLDLAVRLESTQSTVARWEAGEHEMTLSTLNRISDALGICIRLSVGQAGTRP
jgi:predicted transcriptional regulator